MKVEYKKNQWFSKFTSHLFRKNDQLRCLFENKDHLIFIYTSVYFVNKL